MTFLQVINLGLYIVGGYTIGAWIGRQLLKNYRFRAAMKRIRIIRREADRAPF